MRCVFCIVVLLTLSGCEKRIIEFMDMLAGHDSNIVVLEEKPVVVDSSGMVLTSVDAMKVVGSHSSVCLVLKGGVPLSSRSETDRQFQEALQGAVVEATLTTRSGESMSLPRMAQSWDRFGEITSGSELSACYSWNCDSSPVVGAEVVRIDIRTSKPLPVRGIYWTSTDAFDDHAAGS